MKVAVLTIAYKRHHIFKIWASWVSRLGIPVCVVHDEEEIGKTCKAYKFMEVIHANTSLSDKWNAGLSKLKEYDYVLILGSDDLPYPNLLTAYTPYLDAGVDYLGITDGYFYDIASGREFYWPGYTVRERVGKTSGAGRILSKKLLRLLEYKLTDEKVHKSFDHYLDLKISKHKVKVDTINSMDNHTGIVSIQNHLNLTRLEDFPNLEEIGGGLKEKLIERVNARLLIILPVYNSEDTLAEALDSLLDQEYKRLRIHVVNDASTDNTGDVIERYLVKYPDRIKATTNGLNVGCYRSINRALYYESYEKDWEEFVIIGADDYQHPDRFTKQYALFTDSILGVGCGWERVDSNTKKLLYTKASGSSMFIFKREVFDTIGYYDSCRYGADTEFYYRALTKFGDNRFTGTPEVLETSWMTGKNLTKDCGATLFTDDRLMYLKTFQLDHKLGKLYRWYIDKPIVASFATMRGREASALDTLESLLVQVDHVYVWANPGSKFTYNDPRVTVRYATEDIGDIGKFCFDYEDKSRSIYRLSCDDDLLYPYDYATRTINNIRYYGGLITYHGRLFEKGRKYKSYYRDALRMIPCLHDVQGDQRVHCPGTGVSGYDTKDIRFHESEFKYKNMADVFVGILCHKKSITRTAICHYKGWIKDGTKYDHGDCICNKECNNDKLQTELVNSVEWPTEIIIDKSTNQEKKTTMGTLVQCQMLFGPNTGSFCVLDGSTANPLATKGLVKILPEPCEISVLFVKPMHVDKVYYQAGQKAVIKYAVAWEWERKGICKMLGESPLVPKEEKVILEVRDPKPENVATKKEKVITTPKKVVALKKVVSKPQPKKKK